MPDKSPIFYTYRDCLRMYASMLRDLAEVDSYVDDLVHGKTKTEFDRTIHRLIENTLKQK